MTSEAPRQLRLRYEEMLPGDLEQIVRERPLAWIPVGTLEWHGRHLPVGLDAVKAHALCLRIADRAGGVVLPPSFVSMGGLRFPWTHRHDPSVVLRGLWTTLEHLHRQKFKVLFVVTGHYPLSQVLLFIAAAHAFMALHDCVVVSGPEFFMASDGGYFGDHAAKWETSILMELRPDLVGNSELPHLLGDDFIQLHLKGVFGDNPAHDASPETGAAIVEEMIGRFSDLSAELLASNDKNTARRFHRDALGRFFGHHAQSVMNVLRDIF